MSRTWLIYGVLVLVVMDWLAFLTEQRDQCADRGGQYVRGVVWFECVEDGRP